MRELDWFQELVRTGGVDAVEDNGCIGECKNDEEPIYFKLNQFKRIDINKIVCIYH